MAVVDYYYSLISPWSYLGHDALLATAAETGATIVHRPVRIFELFAANGAVPLPQRAPARQRYRLIELQRWREQRGLPLNLQPAFYPVDVADADRIVIALAGTEIDPSGFAGAAFRALWAEERNLAERATLAALLDACGHPVEAVLAAAATEAVEERYVANTRAAIAADLPGLPGYVLAGEPFWGQDRIEQLHVTLAGGRAPYGAG